jgi:hypothetical protein
MILADDVRMAVPPELPARRRHQDAGGDVLDGEAAERLDEPHGMLVGDGIRATGARRLYVGAYIVRALPGEVRTRGDDPVLVG